MGIITHQRWLSCELYSIGLRNYFGFNGTLYILTQDELSTVLLETKGMNPKQCCEYLIEQVTNRNKFKKISG